MVVEEDLLPSSSSSTAKSTNNKPPKYIEKQVTNFWGVRDINSFGEYTVANDYETLASFEEREEDTYAFGEETDISDPLEFIAVDCTIHPADDPITKWSLCSIFGDNLESPNF
ncbi:22029_t:CDS:2, partial [Entrophospora sp. SA101]